MMPDIRSTQNQRVKDAIKLRQRGGRDKQARFAVDGLREISQAIAAGVELVEAFVCQELCQSELHRQLLSELQQQQVAIATVTKAVWNKLAYGDRHDGILAVAAMRQADWSSVPGVDCPLILVLEGIEKPGNVGAILRTADAAGVTAVILSEPRTDLYNPNTIRASLGAVFLTPVIVSSNEEVAHWLAAQSVTPYVSRLDASAAYDTVNLAGPAAIVLGSEAKGVSDFWLNEKYLGIRLPMLGQVDSLNVSSAAAVLMYEAVRQRAPH
jgi:TrmH family RNA methyltransferase